MREATPSSSTQPSLDDVREFWDSLPLGAGYLKGALGSREWYDNFDRLKSRYGLLGVLVRFAPAELCGKFVLDVGSGPGFWSRHLARMGANYTGIDISMKSVALANLSLRLFELSGNVQVANAEALPFEGERFDAVVSEGVIHHTPNTQACIDEIHRVLKPGGRAAVSVYYRVALLRSPALFSVTTWLMRTTGAILGGRGREGMPRVGTPEEFVRMYDGAGNPIGKAYTKHELRKMFAAFSSVKFYRYFMPPIPQFLMLPAFARRTIARLGLMTLAVATK